MENESKELVKGTWFGIGAYLTWGIFPLYWKLLAHIPAGEVLAHRILWSLLFMLIILLCLQRGKSFLLECKHIFTNKKMVLGIFAASILVSINWYTFIYAVSQDRIVESSLGYYINPLVSVLLGILVLKERLSFYQMVSFLLATAGVLIITISFGAFPWIALTLAVSFGLYGLVKKLINLDALTGITIETAFVVPIALLYITTLEVGGTGSFIGATIPTMLLLLAAGAVTAIPLLLFASSARRIPLYLVGFLQYITPSMQLFIGVIIFQESFTKIHFFSFLCIWIALLIFSFSRTKWLISKEPKLFKKEVNTSAHG